MGLLCFSTYFILAFYFISSIEEVWSRCDSDIEGYYWRHYSGKIPRDALLGGTSKAGNPTYIGQTVSNGILIPGQIIAEEQKMYFEWGDREHVTKTNIKILCTQEPHRFEWIRTNKDDIQNLTEKNFIYGGFELSYTVYIGRVQVNDELAVGKVIVTTGRAAGMHTTSNGRFVRRPEFEVLNYDADVPDVSQIRKSLAERNLYVENSARCCARCHINTFILVLIFLFLGSYCWLV